MWNVFPSRRGVADLYQNIALLFYALNDVLSRHEVWVVFYPPEPDKIHLSVSLFSADTLPAGIYWLAALFIRVEAGPRFCITTRLASRRDAPFRGRLKILRFVPCISRKNTPSTDFTRCARGPGAHSDINPREEPNPTAG